MNKCKNVKISKLQNLHFKKYKLLNDYQTLLPV